MYRIMKVVWVMCLALILAGQAVAQDWDKVEFQSTELAPGMWMIFGAGGNHVLAAGPEDVLLIDADYGQVSDKLLAMVRELAGEGPLRVVDTHWHFDHVGGNEALREAGAQLIANQNVRRRMMA